MDDEQSVLEIKQLLIKKLQEHHGYCGVAEGNGMVRLNSGNGNIVIKIEWESSKANE